MTPDTTTPIRHQRITPTKGTTMLSHLLRAGAIAALLGAFSARAHAASSIEITVTLTIAADIQIVWCDNLAANDTTTAQTWALGTVALSSTYDYLTGTAPTYQYIQNNGNTTVDVDLSAGNSTSGWTADGPGANAFLILYDINDSGTYSSDGANSSTRTDAVNALANDGSTVAHVECQLQTPTSITVGGGVSQSITVTATASIDN